MSANRPTRRVQQRFEKNGVFVEVLCNQWREKRWLTARAFRTYLDPRDHVAREAYDFSARELDWLFVLIVQAQDWMVQHTEKPFEKWCTPE